MNNKDTVIPDEYVDFFKEVVELAAKMNLNRMSMKITPGYYGPKWQSDINMQWDNIRHGKLYISSEVTPWSEHRAGLG